MPEVPSPLPDTVGAAARVIVLESSLAIRRNLAVMLRAGGATVLGATTVAEALAVADAGEADLVVCGARDGGLILRELAKARSRRPGAAPWALIAVVPDAFDEAEIEALVEVADDFLQMPLSVSRLSARLRMYARMRAYIARTQAQQAALKLHQHEAEEEQRIASHLISRLERRDAVAERVMHAWVLPAHHLSGDVVAVARSPDDRIHLLLADGTGHGLAAAISVLPVSEVFHRMTDRGFDIPDIVIEMNRKLRSCMPADRFVACAVASIDMRERVIEVWNGGCPPVMLLSAQGAVDKVWRSRHMALGILEGVDFDASVERHTYHEPGQIMVVSDGMSEALASQGNGRFGDRDLLDAVQGPASGRLQRVVNGLRSFTGGQPLEDDASIVLVDCLLEPLVELAPPKSSTGSETRGATPRISHWLLELRLGPSQLRRIALGPFVSGLVEQFGVPGHLRSNVFCVLSELLNNALDYGVMGLDPALLGRENGRERFRAERQERLARLETGSLWIKAAVEPGGGEQYLHLEIEDSGRGFAVDAASGMTGRSNPGESSRRGRGLELVRSVCEDLRFDQDGRRVIALVALGPLT